MCVCVCVCVCVLESLCARVCVSMWETDRQTEQRDRERKREGVGGFVECMQRYEYVADTAAVGCGVGLLFFCVFFLSSNVPTLSYEQTYFCFCLVWQK